MVSTSSSIVESVLIEKTGSRFEDGWPGRCVVCVLTFFGLIVLRAVRVCRSGGLFPPLTPPPECGWRCLFQSSRVWWCFWLGIFWCNEDRPTGLECIRGLSPFLYVRNAVTIPGASSSHIYNRWTTMNDDRTKFIYLRIKFFWEYKNLPLSAIWGVRRWWRPWGELCN